MRIFSTTMLMLLMASYCLAVPADEGTFSLKQPDGSVLEARFVGDEKFHVLQTEDGYFLKEDLLGYYTYINNEGEPSGIYARNSNERSDSDVEFLTSLDQSRIYDLLLKKNPPMEPMDYRVPDFAYREVMRMPSYNPKVTQGDVRGIVILVQFQDVRFKSADPKSQFTDYMNKEGYNEYYNLGSIRDYFVKNSMGLFRPTFDVYGPVTISRNRNDYGTTSSGNDGRNYEGARSALIEALDSLKKKESIDYSKYDNDGDGEIDFTYMFYAGVGANNSGVVGAIWPHAWYIGNSVNKRSGKNMGNDIYANRYACSNEIDGYAYKKDNSTDILGGIGTFAHEFSHVLGLPDMYDLKGNNPRKTPKKWDVMDNGNYNCPYNSYGTQNCAPPFYSAFERMSLGWMTPTELYTVGQVKLDKIDGNNAYSITNPNNPDEMFLLEYRTQKDWDVGQPNSGMLIWHIDYVASVWKEKTVNNDGNHMHVDIEEASPEIDKYARPYDVFPGTKVVTEFSDFRFWSGARAEVLIYGISESEDKTYALFNVEMEISSSSEESSSSEGESSSSMIQSSSSEDASSSSMTPSSSSERFVQYARRGHTACDVSLDHRNNVVLVQLPKAGNNRVRLFSLNGNLVYDKFFEGNFVKAALPATLGKQSFVILVEQNGMLLTTRQIR